MRIDFRFAQGKEGWDLAVTSAKKKVGMGQTIATILRDHIVYRKQILLGTPITCLYQVTDDGRHQVEIRSGQGKDTVHHAFLWFY